MAAWLCLPAATAQAFFLASRFVWRASSPWARPSIPRSVIGKQFFGAK
jgi:hypothetical protein